MLGCAEREIPPKEIWMNRTILFCALFVAVAAALGAQQESQPSPYQGTSNPPADDAAVTISAPPVVLPLAQPAAQPALREREHFNDPDGDIVHPRALGSGELEEGVIIRVRLVNRLSTASSENGEDFQSRVATDVLQGGRVVIPAGTEIDGHVVEASSGHFAGHGTLRLRPESVILADGTRYRLYAELTGTPGSGTRLGGEGTVRPGSRAERNGIEYGGAVGAGVITGAVVGGPVGALTGGLIGAGLVTAHLLINHPQATLEPGTTLLFTLTERMSMVPAGASMGKVE
jgi:hypothetical protein